MRKVEAEQSRSAAHGCFYQLGTTFGTNLPDACTPGSTELQRLDQRTHCHASEGSHRSGLQPVLALVAQWHVDHVGQQGAGDRRCDRRAGSGSVGGLEHRARPPARRRRPTGSSIRHGCSHRGHRCLTTAGAEAIGGLEDRRVSERRQPPLTTKSPLLRHLVIRMIEQHAESAQNRTYRACRRRNDAI
jgi:hypothetical protein